MRLNLVCGLVLLTLGSVLIAGCGGSSPSYADTMRSAVTSMQSAIQTYNQRHISSLAAESPACRTANSKLVAEQHRLRQAPPAHYRRVVAALRRAYALARQAFADCAAAARSINYPLMARAEDEVAQANAWIARARRLDR
jgi:hypothetical protein